MKILLILNGLGNEGITNIALAYLREIVDREIRFEIVAAGTCEETILQQLKQARIPVYQLPSRKKNTGKYMYSLYKLLNLKRYDVVHVHGNSATMAIVLFVSWMCRCKIRIAHCHNTKCDNEKLNTILRPFLLFFSTANFACSTDAGKWLYKSRKFEVIQNGRDIDKYLFNDINRKKIRSMLGVKENEILIGHVGTFTYQKNQNKLINILLELKKMSFTCKLILIGDGSLKEEVQHRVKENNLNKDVIFTGNVSNVNEYLSAFDIMVLPSRYEGLPLVSIEWQANGLPCIFSSEITKQCKVLNNVIFLDLDDSNEVWARTIIKMAKNGREKNSQYIIEQMQKKGFDIKINAQRLKTLYLSYMR